MHFFDKKVEKNLVVRQICRIFAVDFGLRLMLEQKS